MKTRHKVDLSATYSHGEELAGNVKTIANRIATDVSNPSVQINKRVRLGIICPPMLAIYPP